MALLRSSEGLGEGVDKRHNKEREPNVEVSTTWVGGAGERIPVLLFSTAAINFSEPPTPALPSTCRLTFKIMCGANKIVHTLLLAHGFSEVSSTSVHFNLMWTARHMKMHTFKLLLPHQKINHFPRSYELTKKDNLSQNVRKMQLTKGLKYFDIIPKTFTIPKELHQFRAAFQKRRGTWIMKPTTLSRGRGISLITDPSQVTRDQPVVVSQYIGNPLCVDGFKFDVRLYVAVTSYDPLRIYLYEEGLTRFATVRYAGGGVELDNLCMHLTNFSINKMSQDYVRCDDSEVEDYGSKWSMSALLRYLQDEGFNVAELMMRIEDVIVKTILCAEPLISDACRIFQSHRGNCFELYGFDILIDEHLKPWVLEVNLSPSLVCGTPLDLRLKSNLVADLLSLAGIVMQDPYTGRVGLPQRPSRTGSRTRMRTAPRQGLSAMEVAVARETKQEYARRGGFVRIFPSEYSWKLYGAFLDIGRSPLNYTLHCQLYPDSVKVAAPVIPCSLTAVMATRLQSKSSSDSSLNTNSPAGLTALERVAIYLRKLKNQTRAPQSHVSCHEPNPRPHLNGPPSQWEEVPSCAKDHPQAKAATISTPLDRSISSTTESMAHLLKNAGQLSKLQAREVFATYLECVQVRLLRETSIFAHEGDTTMSTDQMNIDLVVHFLKRAAVNLKSPFTVVVPNHHLPLRDRRRILAKQLSEFVILYKEETTHLLRGSNKDKNSLAVHSDMLSKILLQASEYDLELLLTAYAKQSQSKSSAVFLGDTGQDGHATTVDQSKPKTTADLVQPLRGRADSAHILCRHSLNDKHTTDGTTTGTSRFLSDRLTDSSGEFKISSTTDMSLHKQSWTRTGGVPPDLSYPTSFHSDTLLQSNSLLPGRRKSLEKLTSSLAGWSCKSQEPSSVRVRKQSSEAHVVGTKVRPHQRSLSLQSLESTASETSRQSSQSRALFSGSTASFNANSTVRQSSTSAVTSVNKPYISPYAQPVRVTSASKPPQPKKKSQATSVPHSLLGPAVSEESIISALQRLTQRQNSRQYARPTVRRPIIAQAWVQPSTSTCTGQKREQAGNQISSYTTS